MTDKPKSFTTEITWFEHNDKYPEDKTEILIKVRGNKRAMYAWFNSQFGFCAKKVEYWAYLPEFPEIK